ncbi:hypothetical protein AVEN_113251-1 [Araneus ventricosus]|uniref:Uncharacterized protein n=1 Tax=Araneus ventricosus TaxID=182803 RepID=A0A4Y2HH11_ARAVE|nr:hypothetical protein AVEN_113251-1 [Araneus ventricosus]
MDRSLDWATCKRPLATVYWLDLNTCDCFLWGYFKDTRHPQNTTTHVELEQIVHHEYATTPSVTLLLISNFVCDMSLSGLVDTSKTLNEVPNLWNAKEQLGIRAVAVFTTGTKGVRLVLRDPKEPQNVSHVHFSTNGKFTIFVGYGP